MDTSMQGILATIQQFDLLKDTLRTAWTSSGKQESTAEHSWRLAMICLLLKDYFPQADTLKLIELALCHDLGEAYTGDIAAPLQKDATEKLVNEEKSLTQLFKALPADQATYFLALINEYNQGQSYEAKIIKALDKIETIIQHNQGKNPIDFDYTFNLTYGKNLAEQLPELNELRRLIDLETSQHLREF